MKKIITLAILLLLIGLLVFGIYWYKKEKPVTYTGDKINVTASFYPYYFLLKEIGGDKVDVTNITPSGAEPHDYELTTGDIVKIRQSKLLVINGLVETWKAKVSTSVNTLEAGEGLFLQQYKNEEGVSSPDPHIWLNISLYKDQAQRVAQSLESIDPDNKIYYQVNLDKLLKQLDLLDKKYKSVLAPCKKRDIVTSHSAFGYLAPEYSLRQISIAGLSPDEEPSLKQLSEIADFAKQNGVKYIFFESLVSPKLSETIANEAGIKTMVLNPLEGLTPDDEKAGKNYLTIMEDNLHNLSEALECNK